MRNFLVFFGLFLALFSTPVARAELVEGDIAPAPTILQITPAGADSRHALTQAANAGEYVLIDFFSVTCGFCIRDLPKIAAFAREIAGKATVRVVGIDRDEARMRKYRAENPNNFPFDFALDSSRQAMRAYGVTGTPTYFLVDPTGRIVFVQLGELEPGNLDRIRDLIGMTRN